MSGRGAASRWRRLWRDESGTATLEFTIIVPALIAIFLASFESGFFMIRRVALERGLDIMVRDLRLGLIADTRMASLKHEICRHTILFTDCASVLRIELTPWTW